MKPLGFSLDQMKAVMRDIEALDDPATDAGERDAVRRRLDEIRQDATERRRALVRQLEMADEFIDLITTRRG
jgi:MerR family copper efflux transcriptional regulator